MPHHIRLGKMGEDLAVQYLIDKGHRILHRNYKYNKTEIDIISQSYETVVFTEVKTRTTLHFGYPEDAVTKSKKQKILNVLNYYIETFNITIEPRIDIIAITIVRNKVEIVHLEDAFYHF